MVRAIFTAEVAESAEKQPGQKQQIEGGAGETIPRVPLNAESGSPKSIAIDFAVRSPLQSSARSAPSAVKKSSLR